MPLHYVSSPQAATSVTKSRRTYENSYFKEQRHNKYSDGPCVSLLCEFDALPDIGDACGQNLIAEVSIGAALAVQEGMKTHSDICGKVIVLGTSTEASLGGKELLLSRGALHGIDAAHMSHPSLADALTLALASSQQDSIYGLEGRLGRIHR
ncbi:xaa-Arg dipeptidase-like [Amblyomma americanum]